MPDDTETWSRRNAKRVSRTVFYAVLLAGLALVVLQTAPHAEELVKNPFSPQDRTKIVTQKDGAGTVTSVEETTEPRPGSLLEQALAPAGLVFVRVALVGLAAFVAAALASKVLEGDYDIKAGPLEIKKQVDSVSEATKSALEAAEEAVGRLEATLRDESHRRAGVADIVDALIRQVARLDEEVGVLKRTVTPLTTRQPPS